LSETRPQDEDSSPPHEEDRSLRAKIARAFPSPPTNQDAAKDFLVELRTNWRDTEKSISRMAVLIVGLAAVFEVVINNSASEATFMFIKLRNINSVAYAMPVLIAYLYYHVSYLFLVTHYFMVVHDGVVKRTLPDIYDNDLEKLLAPANSLLQDPDRLHFLTRGSHVGRITLGTGAIRPLVVLSGPPGFLAFCYVRLFENYGSSNGVLWLSLCIGAALTIAGVTHVVLLMKYSD